MIIVDRRAAEQLEHALTTGRAPDPATPSGRRTAALLDVAVALRSIPGPAAQPSAAFRAQLRDRLDAEAAVLAAARAALPTQRRDTARLRTSDGAPQATRTGRKRQVLAGTLAAVLVSGTAAAVISTTALPGDALYPMKRSIENVRGSVGSDAARGAAALHAARERLDEAEALVLRGQEGDVDEARSVLLEFGAGARAGSALLLDEYAADGDPAHLREVRDFAVDTAPRLERIREAAPDSLHPTIDALLALLGDLGVGLGEVLATCGDPCSRAGVTPIELVTGEPLDEGARSATSGPAGVFAPAGVGLPTAPTDAGAPSTPHTGASPPSTEVEIVDGSGASGGDGDVTASVPGATGSLPLDPGAGTSGSDPVGVGDPLDPVLSPSTTPVLPAPTLPDPPTLPSDDGLVDDGLVDDLGNTLDDSNGLLGD